MNINKRFNHYLLLCTRVCIMNSGITGNRYITKKCKLFMYYIFIGVRNFKYS